MATRENPPDAPRYSVVVPLYNEQENLPELYRRIRETMDALGEGYEMVFVNDGSTDDTLSMLKDLSASDPKVVVVCLSRNFGQESAVCAGLETARGREIALMDGDLQDPPELIRQLVDKKAEGYDVVYGVKAERKESAVRRGLTKAFYRLMYFLSQVHMPMDAGLFSLFDARVARDILSFTEANKYMSGMRAFVGYRQVGITYRRDARRMGQAKSLFQLLRMGLNAFFSFTIFPLRVVSLFCVLGTAVGLGWLVLGASQGPGVSILLFQGSLLCFGVACICEYLGRVHVEVKHRPDYLIDVVLRGGRCAQVDDSNDSGGNV